MLMFNGERKNEKTVPCPRYPSRKAQKTREQRDPKHKAHNKLIKIKEIEKEYASTSAVLSPNNRTEIFKWCQQRPFGGIPPSFAPAMVEVTISFHISLFLFV
jgi:hypothetical protein